MKQTRQQHRKAGHVVPDTEHPLTAMEQQPAVLHCDVCEQGDPLHTLWRSVDGWPLTVRCIRHLGE